MAEGAIYTTVNICFPQEPAAQRMAVQSVRLLVDRLFADQRYRAFLIAIGTDPDRQDRLYVLTQFDGAAPPAGVTVFNDLIDVLSVPAPIDNPVPTVRQPIDDSVPARTQYLLTVPCVIPGLRRPHERAKAMPFAGGRVPTGVCLIDTVDIWCKGIRGAGVGVAIVDTGSGPHFNLPSAVAGHSFVPGTGKDYRDTDGHGTHVAGTVLARGMNGSIFGVAPASDLYVAKAALAHDDQCHDEWVANAIVWAADRVRVVNVSLGCSQPSEPLERAVAYAFGRDVAVCAAAGDGHLNPPVLLPAAHSGATGVGASTLSDRRCPITSLGDEIDIWGPGCPIESIDLRGDTIVQSGTSGSSPHVAGVVALLLSARQATLQEIRRALATTAEPLDFDKKRGRVSARAALA